ncbi:hypothetical protein FACS189476_09690 [Spirochaetia bacterium]|nr:hypothetical protein FACS189476_09690 [Spirochaetia bacterium]
MIGFLIKKTFFDLWDNLFRVALLNLGFIASLAIPVFLPGLLLSIPPLSVAVMAIGILWCSVYLAAASMALKRISDYGSFGFGDLPQCLKETWLCGLLMGAALFAVYLLATIIIPFYLSIASLFGLLLAAVIFWTMAVCVVSLQFFFPIRARLDTNLIKVFKKCFIIFFDNPGFCIFSFIHNVIILAISGFLAFLFPGPAGILLFLDEALRLRLLKYDWLEENTPTLTEGAAKPKRIPIPWDAILIDERERTGTRSFKSFIFPWKD